MRNDKVKISEVAQESNVSLATVSLVLNNRPGVSQTTRARVFDACEKLGYPIKAGNANKSTRLNTLGMIVKSDSDITPQANPFYSKVISGIELSCRKNGIDLLFSSLPVDENNRVLELPPLLSNRNVDGLLMVGAFWDETIFSIKGVKLPPIILVDGYSNTEHYDTVISDNFRAAYQIVEYLIAKGHRHIGIIGGDQDAYQSLRERRNGYLRALKENNIAETYLANFNINKTKGQWEMNEFLKKHPQVTAVFGVNDQCAVDMIRIAQENGRNVPQDLSVVGYDDINLAANANPALTTMHVDTVAMGRMAVQMLQFRLDHPNSARMTMTIHPELVERNSVRDLNLA